MILATPTRLMPFNRINDVSIRLNDKNYYIICIRDLTGMEEPVYTGISARNCCLITASLLLCCNYDRKLNDYIASVNCTDHEKTKESCAKILNLCCRTHYTLEELRNFMTRTYGDPDRTIASLLEWTQTLLSQIKPEI